jgi:hypothetical protein
MAAKRRLIDRETVTTERVAMVAWLLLSNPGTRYTTGDLARRTEMNYSGMRKMLGKMSRVIPIIESEDRDGWYIEGDVPY